MFSSIGITEILIILSVALIIFGGRKIPQLARDLGGGIREFKRSLTNAREDINLEYNENSLNDGGSIASPIKKRKSVKTPKKAQKNKKSS